LFGEEKSVVSCRMPSDQLKCPGHPDFGSCKPYVPIGHVNGMARGVSKRRCRKFNNYEMGKQEIIVVQLHFIFVWLTQQNRTIPEARPILTP